MHNFLQRVNDSRAICRHGAVLCKQSRVREHHAMARRFTMEMNKVKVPLVLVKNIGDHLLFAVVHQVVAPLPSNRKVSSR